MDSCLHGRWESGICKCERGYVSEFKDTELYPIYCAKKDDELVINLGKVYDLEDYLHYGAMTLTVWMTVGSCLVFMFFWYTITDAWLLSNRIKKAEKKLKDFESNLIRRKSTEVLNAELWYPDMNKYICVNDPEFSIKKATLRKEEKKVLYAKVLYNYKPKEAGELQLRVGDTITNVMKLNHGWCKGMLKGKLGFYPESYAEMFEPSSSDAGNLGIEDEVTGNLGIEDEVAGNLGIEDEVTGNLGIEDEVAISPQKQWKAEQQKMEQ